MPQLQAPTVTARTLHQHDCHTVPAIQTLTTAVSSTPPLQHIHISHRSQAGRKPSLPSKLLYLFDHVSTVRILAHMGRVYSFSRQLLSFLSSPFQTLLLTRHLSRAPKSYPCLHPGCPSRAQFTRAADLERHHKTVHFVEKKLDCPERWCGRVGDHGFTRRDHLIEHQRSFHMQDVPKKKPRHSG